MKTFLVLMFVGYGILTPAGMTLEQAVRDGLELAASIRNGRIDVENAERRLRLARSRFLPDLDAGGSWRYQSERMQLVIDPVIQNGSMMFPGLERTVGTRNNWDFYLGITQPIYTGGMLSRRRDQAAVQVDESSLRLQGERVKHAAAIRSAYFSHALLRGRLETARKLEERLELHLRRIEALAAEKMARRSDVLETRSRLVDARVSIQELEQALTETAISFHELCGHSPGEVTPGQDLRRFSREQAQAFFYSRHPGLEEMAKRSRWLELEEKTVVSRYRPSMAAFAAVHLGRPGIDMFSADWMGYAVLGVSLSMPVFHWNRSREERGLVQAMGQKLNNQRDDLVRGVSHALDRLFQRLDMLQSQVGELQKLVDLKTEDVELKQALYREQQISNLDYLAVLSEQAEAESRLEMTRSHLKLTHITVHRVIGYMQEEK